MVFKFLFDIQFFYPYVLSVSHTEYIGNKTRTSEKRDLALQKVPV